MLNRLFIVVGVIAILAIVSAFAVPHLIPWNNYRAGMEAAASDALGAPVRIKGDIQFQLLPQPLLSFGDVSVGPADAPVLAVDHVTAELSLLDFIRDRYRITHLSLEAPEIALAVAADGTMATPLPVTGAPGGQVTIEEARLTAGTLLIADARSSGALRLDGIAGEVKFPGPGAPLQFSGSGVLGGSVFDLRFTSTVPTAEGRSKLAVFVQRADEGASLSAEGDLTVGAAPRFKGDLTLRAHPPAGNTDLVRGDLVITSSIEAGLDKVLLASYTIVPDENRAGTRLTGAASLTLGPQAKFDAVISGGVLALPPRDATSEQAVAPYELVRLLDELPAPPVIGVPGTLGVDIAEVDLRALALRDVRFDAQSGAGGWSVKNFSAVLPGNSRLELDGVVGSENARPTFTGSVAIETERLDALAQLWRKPQAPNPLFNRKASYTAKVALAGQSLSLSDGTLTLDETPHAISATIGFGESRRIDIAGNLGTLDAADSAALAALLPDFSASGAFGVTFPRGSLAVVANEATVLGLTGKGLDVEGNWEGGVVDIKSLKADDLGGAGFDVALTVFGTLARPELFGQGSVKVNAAGAPALDRLFGALQTPELLREAVARALPADLALKLDQPAGNGSQMLTVAGTAGVAQLNATAQLGAGLLRTAGSPVSIKLDLVSSDVPGLSAQLGFADADLLPPQGPMHLALSLAGSPGASLQTSAVLEAGTDSLGFAGSLATRDAGRWSGSGSLKAVLSDPGAIAESLGAGGMTLPPIAGTGQLAFTGLDSIKLADIDAKSGEQPVHGELALVRQGNAGAVSGDLEIGAVPVEGVTALLVGPAALISSGERLWPDGPIVVGGRGRTTTGRVHVTASNITAGGSPLLDSAEFDVNWDTTAVRLSSLTAALGGGEVTLDASLCCAGTTPQKTLTARVGVDRVDLPALLPEAAASALGGTLSGAAQVQGTGDSLAAAVSSLAGEGSFTIADFRVAGLASSAFAEAAGFTNPTDTPPEELAGQITAALKNGHFSAPQVAGSFTVAGGVLRNPNLTVEGERARLFGGGSLDLADLKLDAAYTLTPVGSLGEGGYINETTAQVGAHIGGTLLAPERSFDVAGLVDAIQVHAYETELAELERLKAEDEARAQAARAARNAATQASAVEAALTVVRDSHARGQAATAAAGQAARQAAETEARNIAAAEQAAEAAAAAARAATAGAAEAQAPSASSSAPPLQPLVLTPTEPNSRF